MRLGDPALDQRQAGEMAAFAAHESRLLDILTC